MKIKNYLTERLKELSTKIEEHDKLLIHSPTGSGKTRFTCEFAKENPTLKIALLVPTQNLVRNIKHQYSKDYNLRAGYGFEFALTSQLNYFVCTTYDTFNKFNENHFDIVFIDEVHFLASHADFRNEALMPLLNINTKTVFLTGTPEVIDRLPVHKLTIEKPTIKKYVKIYSITENVKSHIFRLIRERDESKLLLIRVNDTKLIDEVHEAFNTSVNILKIYSDSDNKRLNLEQCEETLNDIRNGVIEDCVQVLLTTSIIDAGISLEVNKDVDCHALSDYDMPNVIDMVQLFARVRVETGYSMSLSIYGRFNEFELEIDPPTINVTRPPQLLKRLSDAYEEYSKLDSENYLNVLYRYDIIGEVYNEIECEFDASNICYHRPTDIVRNLQSFPLAYNKIVQLLEDRNRLDEIKLITGKRTSIGKRTPAVILVERQLETAILNDIHLSIFIGNKYNEKRVNLLNDAVDYYNSSNTFAEVMSELLQGLYMDNYKMNLDLYQDLNKGQQESVKAVARLVYNYNNGWQRKTIRLSTKEYSEDINNYLLRFKWKNDKRA